MPELEDLIKDGTADTLTETTTPAAEDMLLFWDAAAGELRRVDISHAPDYLDFIEVAEPAAPGATEVRIWAEADSGKSMLKYQNGDGVVRELGRDLVHIVRNSSGGQIDKGEVVYITGANGSLPTVDLADASDSTKMPAFGLALENIANNSNGFVLESGDIGGIDTSAFNQGDILYVSASTPGGLTATEPTGSNIDQQVGVVIASNAGNGVINVDVKAEIDPALTQTLTNKTLDTPVFSSYTVSGAPSASTAGAGATIYVSDETGGAVLAFSDGTNWRRVTDRAVIS